MIRCTWSDHFQRYKSQPDVQYAKIVETIPICKRVDEIDPEADELKEVVYQDDQLITRREDELTENLLEELSRRDIRKIWVNAPTNRWMSYEEALNQNKTIVQTKIAEPLQDHLISELDEIRSLEAVQRILKEYEASDIDDQLFSEIVSMRSYVPELIQRQEELNKGIDEIEDQDVKLQLVDILRARNPDFDPQRFPSSYRSIVSELANFLRDVSKFKNELKELIVEVDPEATPEISSEELTEVPKSDDEPIIESPELIDVLFPAPSEEMPDFLREGLLQESHQLMQTLTKKSYWDQDQVGTVIEALRELSEESPEIFWYVPMNSVTQSNLFLQTMVRIIIHSQVWPDDILENENFEEVNRWIFTHFTCDLGMLRIPETFWLHEQEFEEYQRLEIRKHPTYSAEFVRELQNTPQDVDDWILRHHQRGKEEGYPEEILSEPWPSGSQKLALCDVYEALTSPRHWREKRSPEKGMEFLEETFTEAQNHYLNEFKNRLGLHPPGALVRLQDDRIALVESVRNQKGCTVAPIAKEEESLQGFESPISLSNPEEELQSYPQTRVAPWSIRKLRWKQDESLNPESLI